MSAVRALVRLLEDLERAGTSVMALARGGRPPEPWTLYPSEWGVFDRRTRCQFYFHAHDDTTREAGHIHTVRLFDDHTVHLVAISLSHAGWPQRLFTLNLWAVGDRWASPARLQAYARRFRIGPGRGEPRLVRFVNLVFAAFAADIAWLQEEKARRRERYRAEHGGAEPFDDRTLEILSERAVDLRARAALGPAVSRPA